MKGLRIVVTCPSKTLIYQRKVDIGHARHGILVKSLRARNVNSFNYVRGCDYVMWVCDRMYVIVGMGEFVRVRYVSSHAHVGVYAYSCSCE